jgi:hypothetical protein
MNTTNALYLKVKIKSLAEEARIIRKEEMKHCNRFHREGLINHRTHEVRDEARNSQVAYAIVRGKDLKTVEPNARTSPNWSRVKTMVDRYGVNRYRCETTDEYHAAKAEQDARLKALMGI